MTTETSNTDAAPVAEVAIPDCEHPEWTLGCERCFYEMRRLAQDSVTNMTEELRLASTNGGILFGWHVVNTLADMAAQSQKHASETLDLHQREAGLLMVKNFQLLSRRIVQICNNPTTMNKCLELSAQFLVALEEEMRKPESEKVSVSGSSGIILTDQ